jgi:phosphoglucosamine mutase
MGKVVDGDAVLTILGTAWSRDKRLMGNTVVSTIMSNMGLDDALAKNGTKLHRSDVGDRNVFYDMLRLDANLGGEASGHFIARDYLPTGDGLLAALLVLEEIVNSGNSLGNLASTFKPFPQLKKNLKVEEKPVLESLSELQNELSSINDNLGTKGRVLLRYSGTEPKIRLLAESKDKSLAETTMASLEAAVRNSLKVID